MLYKNILVDRIDQSIIKITLSRPHVLNALSHDLRVELLAAFTEVNRDDEAAVVILTGTGRSFSVGLDIKETNFDEAKPIGDEVFALMRRIRIPMIAAVNGFAITGGMELAMTCDIVIASDKASFRDTHAQVRIIPGAGNTQRIPRLIGEKRAKELLFTSDFISAQEADRIGLINRVVPAERLEEEVLNLARKIAAQPKDMIQKFKQLVDEGMGMDYRSAMILEQRESIISRLQLTRSEFAARGGKTIKGGREKTRADK